MQAKFKKKNKTMCRVLERTSRSVTVRMAPRRWERLMNLEKAYDIARAVARAKTECENAPSMTVDEALQFIHTL